MPNSFSTSEKFGVTVLGKYTYVDTATKLYSIIDNKPTELNIPSFDKHSPFAVVKDTLYVKTPSGLYMVQNGVVSNILNDTILLTNPIVAGDFVYIKTKQLNDNQTKLFAIQDGKASSVEGMMPISNKPVEGIPIVAGDTVYIATKFDSDFQIKDYKMYAIHGTTATLTKNFPTGKTSINYQATVDGNSLLISTGEDTLYGIQGGSSEVTVLANGLSQILASTINAGLMIQNALYLRTWDANEGVQLWLIDLNTQKAIKQVMTQADFINFSKTSDNLFYAFANPNKTIQLASIAYSNATEIKNGFALTSDKQHIYIKDPAGPWTAGTNAYVAARDVTTPEDNNFYFIDGTNKNVTKLLDINSNHDQISAPTILGSTVYIGTSNAQGANHTLYAFTGAMKQELPAFLSSQPNMSLAIADHNLVHIGVIDQNKKLTVYTLKENKSVCPVQN
jgi:hypothetical protein